MRGGFPSPDDRLRVERVLATTRFFLAAVSLGAVYLDPSQPTRMPDAAYALFTAYVAFAAVVLTLLRVFSARLLKWASAVHVLDVAWVGGIAVFTQGPSTPFFVYFAFILLAAAARWGPGPTLLTGAVAVAVFLLETLAISILDRVETIEITRVIMRGAYLAILSLMLAFLAAKEQVFRAERDTLARVMSAVAASEGFADGLASMMAECLSYFEGREVLLVLQASRSGRLYLWRTGRPPGVKDTRPILEELPPGDMPAYLFPVPRAALVWYVRRVRQAPRARAIHADRAARPAEVLVPEAGPLLRRHRATALLVAEVPGASEWRGRLILVNPVAPTDDDLHFLRTLVAHVSPALYKEFRVRRLRSRAGATERAKVARELHDGLVQSLIGLEMEVEVLRKNATSSTVPEERLRAVRDALRLSVGDLRDVLWRLRQPPATAEEVLRLVAELADRLRRESGLRVNLVARIADLECAPHTCGHLARIAHEALTNVRKHSGARSVAITMAQSETANRMTVEDDGRGFRFAGRLTLEQLEASELGPAHIMERVRAINGRLTIDSRPGEGARIEVEWPKERHG